MHTKISPLTRQYAAFVAHWARRSLPSEVCEVATLGFTDAVGVMLAGAREDAVRTLCAWAQSQGGHPQARVVGQAVRLASAQAALINATAAHALDYDDFAFSNHPSAVLVPSILAVADACPVPGATLVRAYALGYEVWADVFLREKDLYYDRGWHPTSVLGPLGAAVAAAVVLGLDEDQIAHALALAASNASGIFENFGTMAKPYHGGRAAMAGVTAAGMAAAGLRASPTALEGRHGLLRAISPHGQVDLETPMHSGESWRVATSRLNIKKYPVVGAAQRGIEAVLGLNRQQRVPLSEVVRIVARVSERHAAVMPYHRPQDALQAKFSLEFALACALVHDAVGLAELRDEVVQDPRIQALMACVEIETTDAFEPGWRDAAPFDQVFVHLADGRVLASPAVRRATGHADTPLSADEVRAKFMGCLAHAGVAPGPAQALYQQLQTLDTLAGPADLPLPDLLSA